MNKKRFLIIITVLILVILILLVIGKKKGIIGKSVEIKVSTDYVKRTDITETVSANGKIQPEIQVKISSDVSGEIIELPVKEGDIVTKGQLLAKIKPDVYISDVQRVEAALNNAISALASSKARLVQTEAQFNNAKSVYQRNEKLWKQKVISESEWDAATSAYEVAKAEVEAARQNVKSAEYSIKSARASLKEAQDNLSRTNIFSPIDGTVTSLNVEKGERIVGTLQFQGTEMMRISNLDMMVVDADVNENDIVRVHNGDTSIIEVDAYLGEKFKGVVFEIANSSNQSITVTTDQVTNFTVKIRILKDSYKELLANRPANYSPFRPGMSANVEIMTKKASNVLSLPVQAVTTRLDTAKNKKSDSKSLMKEYVFVYNNGIAKLQPVETGIQDNLNIEIKSGLNENTEVIISPYSAISKTLKNDDKVKKVPLKDLF